MRRMRRPQRGRSPTRNSSIDALPFEAEQDRLGQDLRDVLAEREAQEAFGQQYGRVSRGD